MKFLHQSVGVDVSKDDLVVRFLATPTAHPDRYKIRGSRKFANTSKGIRALQSWIDKRAEAGVALQVICEATGSYHEQLTYMLYLENYQVCVVLPNKIKSYAASLNCHSKTDDIDAVIIARFGLERRPPAWQPASINLRQLRSLTRERQQIKDQLTRTGNQLHALEYSYDAHSAEKRRKRSLVNFLNKQLGAVEKQIEQLIQKDDVLADLINRLTTIPQVGRLTASVVVAETDGFALFESREQLIKYAGMDIVDKQSGSSVRGRSRLSKRGNSRLRAALYMPSLGAGNHPTLLAKVYHRVKQRSGCGKKALVAVQRKLLVLMYALAKNGQTYCEQTHGLRSKKIGEPESSPTVTQLAEAGWSS